MRHPWLLVLLLFAGCGGVTHASTAGPTTTVSTAPVELPYQEVAELAACPADAGVLETAEDAYSLLNGSYATMQQLVDAKLLRARSTYFTEVKLGTPRGGYTLVGGPKCGNVPVVGPR